ncbi:MAG TPA: large-conductance mechanosensitive channel protein MscL [Bacteroidales bacterium]|nr:large-conductance mechanosensitive channel protein MscL [Bacteroidales bacterium]HOH22002.1 large-conductance mechanosensitive channel protein MscL [Bacteroidales bacterium]HPZ03466.1 large-conductance mechanosensitive channel protein MscL [Bacteroidales bacterium]HQB74924.1 large-conductance mechanosensitive channel protein MscL [Bacteroidales bacterium]
MMGMLKEFKEFAMKGNLVDMAVAFVMGAAFGKLVSSFIDGLVMPLVGYLTSGTDFSNLVLTLPNFREGAEPVVLTYGAFITVLIDFLVVAFVMFLVIRGMNRLKRKEVAPPPADPTPSAEETLLTEIRDLLKKEEK